jgi:hypothetical protein
MSISACHRSLYRARWIHSTPPMLLFKIYFNIILQFSPLSFKWSLYFRLFHHKYREFIVYRQAYLSVRVCVCVCGVCVCVVCVYVCVCVCARVCVPFT